MTPADAFAAAVRHHQAGQLADADRLYAQVLAAEPSHAHALHLRGALALSTGRPSPGALRAPTSPHRGEVKRSMRR